MRCWGSGGKVLPRPQLVPATREGESIGRGALPSSCSGHMPAICTPTHTPTIADAGEHHQMTMHDPLRMP